MKPKLSASGQEFHDVTLASNNKVKKQDQKNGYLSGLQQKRNKDALHNTHSPIRKILRTSTMWTKKTLQGEKLHALCVTASFKL